MNKKFWPILTITIAITSVIILINWIEILTDPTPNTEDSPWILALGFGGLTLIVGFGLSICAAAGWLDDE